MKHADILYCLFINCISFFFTALSFCYLADYTVTDTSGKSESTKFGFSWVMWCAIAAIIIEFIVLCASFIRNRRVEIAQKRWQANKLKKEEEQRIRAEKK